MAASNMKFFHVVLLVTGLSVTKGEVDCKMPPPRVDFKSCCDLSNLITDELKEKCGIEDGFHGPHGPHGPPGMGPPGMGPPGDVPQGPPGGGDFHGPPGHHHRGPHGPDPCSIACALNETAILVDEELQEDNLQTYLNDLFDDADKVEFLTEKFKQCDEKRKNSGEKMHHKHHGHHGHDCGGPKHGKMLMGCVFMESFKECPDNAWSNTDECNEARDHINQCHPHFGPGAAEQEEEEEEEDVAAI